MSAEGNGPTLSRLLLPYAFDVIAPFLTYLVVQRFGASALWALTAGGLVAGASTVVNTVRRKGLDAVGGLVVLEIVASIALLVFVRDPRLLLVRPSFYTGIAAAYLMASALVGTPLSYPGSRPMAARGGPRRLAAYERAWERSPEFRRIHAVVTFGFGLALAADSVLRVVIVYSTSLERSAWLSNVPHTVAVIAMIGCSALAGRRFRALVDEEMARERA